VINWLERVAGSDKVRRAWRVVEIILIQAALLAVLL